MQIRKICTLTFSLLLASCASHSPVVGDGSGGFFLSKQAATGFPGLGDLESEVYQEAETHCKNQGKTTFKTTSVSKTKAPFVLGNYPRVELRFTCD